MLQEPAFEIVFLFQVPLKNGRMKDFIESHFKELISQALISNGQVNENLKPAQNHDNYLTKFICIELISSFSPDFFVYCGNSHTGRWHDKNLLELHRDD
jgi:hypothetical protein